MMNNPPFYLHPSNYLGPSVTRDTAAAIRQLDRLDKLFKSLTFEQKVEKGKKIIIGLRNAQKSTK